MANVPICFTTCLAWSSVAIMTATISTSLIACTGESCLSTPECSAGAVCLEGACVDRSLRPDPPEVVGSSDLALQVPYAEAVVDGDLAEWSTDTWYAFGTFISVRDASDLSGALAVRWSDRGLYLAYAIVDDVVRERNSGAAFWQDDVLYFHVDLAVTPVNSVYDGSETTFFFGADGTIWQEHSAVPWSLKLQVALNERGYQGEALLKWPSIASPPAGVAIGISARVYDDDSDTEAIGTAEFSDVNDVAWNDPRAHRPAVLMPPEGGMGRE